MMYVAFIIDMTFVQKENPEPFFLNNYCWLIRPNAKKKKKKKGRTDSK